MGFTNYTHQAIIFSFDYLWNISLTLNQTDPDSPLLYHPHDNQTRICLTYDGCIAHVGPDSVLYSSRDVYDRVLLWRAPLIALVATTTLPTLVRTMIFIRWPWNIHGCQTDRVLANVLLTIFRDFILRSSPFCISSHHLSIHCGVCSISLILPGAMQIGLPRTTKTHASHSRPQIQICRPTPPLIKSIHPSQKTVF